MPEHSDLTYAALITLSLPGTGESVSMTVTLMPEDRVEVAGRRSRPLRDCTLRDLQVYADALESAVWDTYEEIALLDLDEKGMVEVEVSLGDVEDAALQDWSGQAILLPAEEDGLAAPPFVEENSTEATEADRPFLLDAMTGVAPQDPPVAHEHPDPVEAQPPALESESPDLTVAEAQLVFPEIEDEKVAKPGLESPVFPAIIPSQARVRVAGERLPLGHPTRSAVDILIDEPALRAAQAHALSSLKREVAGILVGPRPEKQPDGRYLVHVIDTIVAKYTVMQGASVTYTPESWRYLNDTLAERYPDETAVMAGWYHTHPGFGIFLSGMDLFIHQNFFTQIWHVAMVLDPQARTSGFFSWDRPKSRVSRHDFAWPKWAMGSW